MDTASLLTEIDSSLCLLLQGARKRYARRLGSDLFDVLEEFVTRPGKRFRPVLFMLAAGISQNGDIPENLKTIACAFELLHDFALIHDDIIDQSITRRNGPCLEQVWVDRLGLDAHNARGCAMISGDILFALAFELLAAANVGPDVKQRLFANITSVCVQTGASQITELEYTLCRYADISRQDMYRLYEDKTSFYSFVCPLVCGFIVAGKDSEAVLEQARQAGVALGCAYQILDDVGELIDARADFGDLKQNRLTLPVWLMLSGSLPQQVRFICSLAGRSCFDQEEIVFFTKLLKQSNAVEECFKTARVFFDRAMVALKSAQRLAGCNDSKLVGFMEAMFERLFAMRH